MTARERTIATGLGAVLLLTGGFVAVRNSIIAPRAELVRQIHAARELQMELENNVAPAAGIGNRWQRHTRHTLGPTLEDARLDFRNDVVALLNQSNLSNGLRIADKAAVTLRRGPEDGFIELPVTVNVEGELQNLIDFLKDFYQRPYIKRIDQFSISASSAQQRQASDYAREQRDRQADPRAVIRRNESLPLVISMTVSTLVLPRVAGISHETLTPELFDDEELLQRAPRYARADDPAVYNDIARANFFKVYYDPPPPPPPLPRTERPPPVARDPESTPERPPPVDPRRNADQYVLVGTTSLHGEYIAYVNDRRSRSAPLSEYRVNETVDDGRLLLIHTSGMVVRSHDEAGAQVDWYYPLGGNFKQRERLSRRNHPIVWELLQKVTRS